MVNHFKRVRDHPVNINSAGKEKESCTTVALYSPPQLAIVPPFSFLSRLAINKMKISRTNEVFWCRREESFKYWAGVYV